MKNLFYISWLCTISILLSACNRSSISSSENGNLHDEPVPEIGYTDMNYSKWQEGIEFWAVGNEPSWAIDLDFDGEFTLKRLGQSDIAIPAQAAEAFDSGILYFGSSMSFDLVIRIYDKGCTDAMSGMRYQHVVEVDYRERGAAEFITYSGCGNYVNDVKLHNIWVLKELNGEPFKTVGLPKGAPSLEFKAGDGSLFGHDGCNNINGTFVTKGKKLHFGPLMSTKMACPGIQESGSITELLSGGEFTYAITEGELRLMRDLKVVTVFKPVD